MMEVDTNRLRLSKTKVPILSELKLVEFGIFIKTCSGENNIYILSPAELERVLATPHSGRGLI